MSKSISELVKRTGSRTNAIKELVRLAQDGTIEFPFVSRYLPEPNEMMTAYQQTPHNFIFSEYRRLAAYNTPNKLFLPPLFQDSYVVIKSTHQQDYEKINGLTDLFTEDQRIQSRKIYTKESTAECWNDPECLIRIMERVVTKFPDYDVRNLREAVYEISPDPGLFKLMWVRGLLTFLTADQSDLKKCRFLDMSAGWGDRLLGAMSFGCQYLGFDPNIGLKPGHDAMIEMFGSPDRHRVIYQPFEEADISKEDLFDISIISPPFFNIEIYPNEGETEQSIDKFPSVTDWIVGFLFASLQKIWSKLKNGGYLAIHMGDPRNTYINEPMLLFIEQYLTGSSYEGVIGLLGDRGDPAPTWIWQKIEDEPIKIKRWSPSSKKLSSSDKSLGRKIYDTLSSGKDEDVATRSLAKLYPEISERYLASSAISQAFVSNPDKFTEMLEGIARAYDEALEGLSDDAVQLAETLFQSKMMIIPLYLMTGHQETVKWLKATINQASSDNPP